MTSEDYTARDKCVICVSALTAVDQKYSLICPSGCSNVCFRCLSTLHDSTQICPECQMSVSSTIKDTIFMRNICNLDLVQDDSELSAAELRMKYNTAKELIHQVENRLKDPFIKGISKDTQSPKNIASEKSQFITPNIQLSVWLSRVDKIISQEEREYLMQLLTSGESQKLAQAARILYELDWMNQKNNFSSRQITSIDIMSSGNPFHKLHLEVSAILNQQISDAGQNLFDRGLEQEHHLPREGKVNNERLPLLPKYVVLEANFDVYARYQKMLKLKDDVWDGSVADAFVRRFQDQSQSVDDGSSSENESDNHINSQTKSYEHNRVIVTAARRLAYSVGIREGDCISHFNDEQFKGTARELKELINNVYLSTRNGDGSVNPPKTFSLTLNADQRTANALKQYDCNQKYSP